MFLPPGADNPSYTTASARQCKCGRFSLPPYETRKSTEMSATRPAASDGGPVDFRYPASAAGQRLRPRRIPSRRFDACAGDQAAAQ